MKQAIFLLLQLLQQSSKSGGFFDDFKIGNKKVQVAPSFWEVPCFQKIQVFVADKKSQVCDDVRPFLKGRLQTVNTTFFGAF